MIIRKLLTIAVSSLTVMSGFAFAEALMIEPLIKDRDVKVVLDQDEHHFAVMGGCNTLMGKVYISESGAFRVKQGRHGAGLASTLMACPNDLMQLDERLEDFILNTPKVVRKENSLYLVGTIEDEIESVYVPIDLDKGSYLDIQAEPYEQVFYYISSEQVPCEVGSEEQCLQARKDKGAPWAIFEDKIEGFAPIEGYEYRLRLKEYKEGETPVKYVLDMVVEQGQVPVVK